MSMTELLMERGAIDSLAAEAALTQELEDETDAEKEERVAAEAAAERRRLYEEQQAFMRTSPMGLPGMGARVRSGKGRD